MVAIITFPNLYRAFMYNEHKVEDGVAVALHAHLYTNDVNMLSRKEKLMRLQRLCELRPDVETNTMHVSLNFHAADNLDEMKLVTIACEYMQLIGFGNQPYLVYQHMDAAHPHIHIVTTCIQNDGGRISTHNIGRDKSEPARKLLEERHGLIPADGRNESLGSTLQPIDLEKALYGKHSTKNAISNVVRTVVKHYKFTNLVEFNTILAQFNVTADRGSVGTRLYENGGLLYSLVSNTGIKYGIPVKASRIFGKPTLQYLESRFKKNKIERSVFRGRIARVIDDILKLGIISRSEFIGRMKQNGINVIFRENAKGFVYGITYIDNLTHCIFNGSDVDSGKKYTAGSIVKHLDGSQDISGRSDEYNLWLSNQMNARKILFENAKKGVIFNESIVKNSKPEYRKGHYASPRKDFKPADEHEALHLLSAGLRKKQLLQMNRKLVPVMRNMPNVDIRSGVPDQINSPPERFQAILLESISEFLGVQVEPFEQIFFELLKEAKKKRRRRH